jgi:alpha-1,2-mannosyltransferase
MRVSLMPIGQGRVRPEPANQAARSLATGDAAGDSAIENGSADVERQWPWLANTRVRRSIYGLVAVEVAVVIVFVCVYGPFDLNIYLWGGRAVTEGMRLYDVQPHANWFTYPPFAATVFIPFAALPNFVARMIWELASIGALVWSCVLSLKLAGQRPSRIAILAMVAAGFLLEPVYHTLYLGQVNLFLLALVLWDVWRASLGRPAGIGVGIAAAIKLVPGIFIVFFLLTRRVKDAITASVTFLGCGLIGYLVDPSASRLYWTHLFYDTSRVSAAYISNQSPYAAFVRILDGTGKVGSWYLVVVLVLGVVGLGVAATLARREDWLGAAAMTGVAGLMVSPISWTHHWVWIIPALVVMLRGGTRSRIAAACAYVLFVVAPMWFTPHSGEAGDYGFHWWQTLAANSFLIAGLAFMAYMVVQTYRPGPARGGDTVTHVPRQATSPEDSLPASAELLPGL